MDGGEEGFGFAHMEKDWGEAFPDSWIWLQGIKLATSNRAATPEVSVFNRQSPLPSGESSI